MLTGAPGRMENVIIFSTLAVELAFGLRATFSVAFPVTLRNWKMLAVLVVVLVKKSSVAAVGFFALPLFALGAGKAASFKYVKLARG